MLHPLGGARANRSAKLPIMFHIAKFVKNRRPLKDYLEVLCFSKKPVLNDGHVDRTPDLCIRVLNPYSIDEISLVMINKSVPIVSVQAELFNVFTFLFENHWERRLCDYDNLIYC